MADAADRSCRRAHPHLQRRRHRGAGTEAPRPRSRARLSRDVWVVAPEQEQSGASHSLTLYRPLRVRKLGPRRFAVDGTPTDCVLLAVNVSSRRQAARSWSSPASMPAAIIGEDVTYSGTVAAAMEATLLDVPAIALEPACRRRRARSPWATAAAYGARGDPPPRRAAVAAPHADQRQFSRCRRPSR